MQRIFIALLLAAGLRGYAAQTPSQILSTGAAYSQLSSRALAIAQVTLLAQLAAGGVISTPSSVLATGAAFQALSDRDLEIAKATLLNQLVTARIQGAGTNTFYVDITNGNDTVKSPYKTINAAQADMSTGARCVVRQGEYFNDTIYKTNCVFSLDSGAILEGIPSIAVTNGQVWIDGDGTLGGASGGTLLMTNGTLFVKHCALFAFNTGAQPIQVPGPGTNVIQIDWVNCIYTGLDNTSNLLFNATGDLAVEFGAANGPNLFVTLNVRRAGLHGSPAFVNVPDASKAYFKVKCDIADLPNLQINAPSFSNQPCFILQANVFNIKDDESCVINGGVNAVSGGSAVLNPLANPNAAIGFWQTDGSGTMTIKDEITPYQSILGL